MLRDTRDVCIVPTYQRPEFLHLCLEHIAKCPEAKNLRIVLSVDNHLGRPYDPLVKAVAHRFRERLPITVSVRSPHRYHGNTYNVLTAYREAADRGARLIFLVEDDVMVLPDFFRWHYTIHEREPNLFSSVAAIPKHLRAWPQSTDAKAYFTANDYASIGVCLPARSVEIFREHIRPEYFASMVGYVARNFPDIDHPSMYAEQDGMIYRLVRRHHLRSAFPCAQRAFHTGFWGYHRQDGHRLKGDLDTKIRRLRSLIHNERGMSRLCQSFADFNAITPVAGWNTLHKIGEI